MLRSMCLAGAVANVAECLTSAALLLLFWLLLVGQPSVYSAWSAIAVLHFLFIAFSLNLEVRLLHSFGTLSLFNRIWWFTLSTNEEKGQR